MTFLSGIFLSTFHASDPYRFGQESLHYPEHRTQNNMDWHDSSCRLDLVSCDGVQSCMRCGSFAPQPPVLPPLTRPTSIRLLRLFCGSYDEGLRGEVFLEDMSNLPVYEAISYTWADEAGDSSLCESIQLFGQEQLKITRNCQNALKRVRRTSESRILWIDAM
ncbi:hypothetical protein F5Y16DRAFT_167710 [Xylariaceae sp. FL0255]|nr:hypothetical protein F5Y16DRAFT_167710 [Xylariaceae sp. FL0255]